MSSTERPTVIATTDIASEIPRALWRACRMPVAEVTDAEVAAITACAEGLVADGADFLAATAEAVEAFLEGDLHHDFDLIP